MVKTPHRLWRYPFQCGMFLMLMSIGTGMVWGSAAGDFEISSQGPTYTVTYSFITDCPPDTLIQAFLQPVHIVACMRRANLHIEVLDTASWHNHIIYTYSYIISKLRLRFDRSADTATSRVNFTMEACSTSGSSIIPSVRSSQGYYAVTAVGGEFRIDYWQQTTLDRDLTDLYLFFIKRDTRRVLHNQERYVNTRERWKGSDN